MKFLGTMIGPASGSIDGITASRNKGGQYIRRRSTPVNPNSPAQTVARGNFAGAVVAWTELLTQAARDSWTNWATNVTFTDTLGQDLQLSGQQAYIRWASVAAFVNNELDIVAPTVFDNGFPPTRVIGGTSSIQNQFDISAGTLELIVDFGGDTQVSGSLVFQFGRPINPSQTYYNGPYRFGFAATVPAGGDDIQLQETIANIETIVPLADGQRRPYRCRMVYDDGRLSGALSGIATVVEGA